MRSSASSKPVKPQRRELIDAPDESGQPTGPRSGDYVYDVPVSDELEKMLEADPALLAQAPVFPYGTPQEQGNVSPYGASPLEP